MALHGTIEVNDMVLGHWSAQRCSHLDREPEAMDVVEYACEAHLHSTLQGNPQVDWKGNVTHRFGDGALALAARVLSVASIESHVQL